MTENPYRSPRSNTEESLPKSYRGWTANWLLLTAVICISISAYFIASARQVASESNDFASNSPPPNISELSQRYIAYGRIAGTSMFFGVSLIIIEIYLQQRKKSLAQPKSLPTASENDEGELKSDSSLS